MAMVSLLHQLWRPPWWVLLLLDLALPLEVVSLGPIRTMVLLLLLLLGQLFGTGLSGINLSSDAAIAVANPSFSSEGGSSWSNMGHDSDGKSMLGSKTGTDATSSTYHTAGAPRLKSSPVLVLGALALAAVASQFLL